MSLLFNPTPRRQPIRRGLGLLGDSFSGNCHTIAATAFGTEAYGYAGMIAARTSLFPSYLDNQGKLGDHTGQFLARLPGCIASSTADLWLLLSRTNDSTTAGMSLADTKATVMKIVTAFLITPGKFLIVGTGTPCFGSRALTGQALAWLQAYRRTPQSRSRSSGFATCRIASPTEHRISGALLLLFIILQFAKKEGS